MDEGTSLYLPIQYHIIDYEDIHQHKTYIAKKQTNKKLTDIGLVLRIGLYTS